MTSRWSMFAVVIWIISLNKTMQHCLFIYSFVVGTVAAAAATSRSSPYAGGISVSNFRIVHGGYHNFNGDNNNNDSSLKVLQIDSTWK